MEANLSFSGIAELPPKKCAMDREKLYFDEPTVRSEKRASQEKGKSLFDQSKPDQKPQNEDETVEESSKVRTSPPGNLIVCKFCSQKFSSTQALGGHQNAHKQEREMQKAIKEANKHCMNYNYNNFPPPTPPAFHGSYHNGYPHQTPLFYQRYLYRGWQPRSIYPSPNAGLGFGSPGLFRTIQGFSGPSAWVRPVIRAAGPIKRPREPENLDSDASHTAPSFTALLRKWENESAIAKMQRNESTVMNMSLEKTGSETLDFLLKLNESEEGSQKRKKSTEIDLTLKL